MGRIVEKLKALIAEIKTWIKKLIATITSAKFIIIAAVVTVFLTVGTVFYVKYQNMETELANATVELAGWKHAKLEQDKVIVQLRTDGEKQKALRTEAEAQRDKSNAEIEAVRKKYQALAKSMGSKNFGDLAIKQPTIVQDLINNDMKKLNECFEKLSGAPVTITPDNEFCD